MCISHTGGDIYCVRPGANSVENNPVLLSQVSEDIPSMHVLCRLHPTPDHHQPLWWQQVNSEVEIERTWKCVVATCILSPCSPTAMQLAATSPLTPHCLCCLHSLGEFCIAFGAKEPIPAEWTSLPDWKYPRDPKCHRSAYFSCSIKKIKGKEKNGNILLFWVPVFLTDYTFMYYIQKNSLIYVKVCSFHLCPVQL